MRVRIWVVLFIILVLFGPLFQIGCERKEEVAPPAVEEEPVAPEEEAPVEEAPVEEVPEEEAPVEEEKVPEGGE